MDQALIPGMVHGPLIQPRGRPLVAIQVGKGDVWKILNTPKVLGYFFFFVTNTSKVQKNWEKIRVVRVKVIMININERRTMKQRDHIFKPIRENSEHC